MHIPQALKHALQNKYIAATVLALTFWSVFIHDLGLPFVVREARSLEKAKRNFRRWKRKMRLCDNNKLT